MGTVREKMKVFLVVCLMSITFFSQGWGGKHYLVKTKEKEKYAAPEAGDDYNEEYGDDGDGTTDDAYVDDDTYGDGTHDDDTYDEENNGEEIDVESMIIESGNSKLVEAFEDLPEGTKDETIEKVSEAANNLQEGKSEDYNYNLQAIRHILRSFKFIIDAILGLLKKKTYKRHKVKKSILQCRKSCRRKCITKEKWRYLKRSRTKKSSMSKHEICNTHCKSECKKW